MSISPTIETAELLARRAEVNTREVDLRRELGIVFGDAVIFALFGSNVFQCFVSFQCNFLRSFEAFDE